MDPTIKTVLAEFAAKYPALISMAQAAEIAQRPLATLYDWSSRGRFDAFKKRPGRSVILIRDEFVRFIMGANQPGTLQ